MLPNKPYNMPMPKSQLNSGNDLDEGCELRQAEAGTGLDSVTKQLARDATEFTRHTTSHEGSPKNGQPGLPLMSAEGKKMASHTAPSNAYQVTTGSTSAVKEK
jgi:hypothetical protein